MVKGMPPFAGRRFGKAGEFVVDDTAMDLDFEAVEWTHEWIQDRGYQALI